MEIATIGHKYVPPKLLPINWKSTAKNIWCSPVITSGAYNNPYIAPPSHPACWNINVTPDVIPVPINNATGPMIINAKNPVTKSATGPTTNIFIES
ncbi:Uncharacterised protein [Staphylococcus aureus]|nr:Uncharacterised protein [Staphylococcus aureus]CPN25592.1 Uncharacterised protein [Staphylococcus aureus]